MRSRAPFEPRTLGPDSDGPSEKHFYAATNADFHLNFDATAEALRGLIRDGINATGDERHDEHAVTAPGDLLGTCFDSRACRWEINDVRAGEGPRRCPATGRTPWFWDRARSWRG